MKRIAVLAALALAACGPSVKTVTVEPGRATLDAKGATASFRAVARDDKGQAIEAAKVKVAWSSSAPQTASVDEAGTLTALRSGEATVTAAVGEVKGSAQVVVSIPTTIAVSPESRDLGPGEALVLSVVVSDDTGSPVMVPRTITWTTSDPGVARVTDGKVEAVGPGSTTITASTGTLKASAQVSVRVPEFAKLTLSPTKTQTLRKGDKLTLKASALDRKGAKVLHVPMAWKSSDPRVATVSSDGVVAAVKKGNAKVTVSAGGKSASVGITVTDAPKGKGGAKAPPAKGSSKAKPKKKKTR